MKGVGKIVSSKAGELIFSLLSGCAYFIVLMGFIINHTKTGGMLLSFFFLPAIVCGAALIIIKTIRKLKDEEQFGKINMLIYSHIFFIAISIIFLVDILLNK